MNDDRLQKVMDNVYGHAETRKQGKSIDKDGNPLPWMTYPAIFYLDQLDLSDKTVFEWGSGNSSLFFADRVKKITSIEYKSDWYEYVKGNLKDNMTLHLANDSEYASIIQSLNESYDLIIIDGEIDTRMECAKHVTDYLNAGGLIIVDNSDWLANTCEFLRSKGFIQVDMAGFGPINNYSWCTSFFFTRDFNFKQKSIKTPTFVPGGLQNVRD